MAVVLSQTSKPKTPKRLLQLDILRGIAILLVLLRHPIVYPNSPTVHWFWRGLADRLYIFGWTGVDLFFVLSGFLIGGVLFQEIRKTGSLDARRFLIRRGFKIWPAYFTLVAVTFFSQHIHKHLSWKQAFKSIVPNLMHIQNFVGSPRGFTWSLSVEEHFYLALPLLLVTLLALMRGSRKSLPAFPIIAIALIFGVTIYRTVHNWSRPYEFLSHYAYTQLRIDGLFFGVLLAYLHHFHQEMLARFARRRIMLLVGGLLFLLPMMIWTDRQPFVFTIGFTMLYLGYGAIMVALVYIEPGDGMIGRMMDSRIARGVAFVGFYSYSIYLWQQDLGRDLILDHVLSRMHYVPRIAIWPLLEIIQFAFVIASGVIMAKLIETPALALRDRIFPARSGKSGAAVILEPEKQADLLPSKPLAAIPSQV